VLINRQSVFRLLPIFEINSTKKAPEGAFSIKLSLASDAIKKGFHTVEPRLGFWTVFSIAS